MPEPRLIDCPDYGALNWGHGKGDRLVGPGHGPCLKIVPVIDQLAFEMAGRIRVAKLNINEIL